MADKAHLHGDHPHVHAHAEVPHNHLLRGICHRPECAAYPTHNIHPAPGDFTENENYGRLRLHQPHNQRHHVVPGSERAGQDRTVPPAVRAVERMSIDRGEILRRAQATGLGADEIIYLDLLAPPAGQVSTVFDVGAADGTYTDAVRAAWPGPTICHLFEPRPTAAAFLRAKYADNPHTFVHEHALAEQIGTRTFVVTPSGNGQHSHMRAPALPDEHEIEIDLDTVDHMIAELGIDTLDLLKIDTEGYELPVLRGAVNSLPRIRAVQFEYGATWIGASWVDDTTLAEAAELLAGFELYRCQGTDLLPLDDLTDDYQQQNILAVRPRPVPKPETPNTTT